MTTKTKPKNKKRNKSIPDNIAFLRDADFAKIKTADIELSPLNYRRYFSEEALQQFAEELKLHGIISPLTVRPAKGNKYELVAGERRLKAARIAGLTELPCAIVSLTDEQVIEIQLSENLQRENPHPMHEAQGIGQMQQAGKSIDEISARLGKSKQFVYLRLKLLSLIESFQEMILANAITIQEALKIAVLSVESQSEFFDENCSKWKKQKDFCLHDLDWYLDQYRYDLKKAPFNTKDKKLVPEAGACTTCPSNSATLKTLFPELAKKAVCTNKECYNNKCKVHFLAVLNNVIDTYKPTALLYNNQLTEMGEKILSLIPEAFALPRYNYHEVSVIEKPECPDKEDYIYNNDDTPELDTEEFGQAMDDYYSQLEAYNLHVQSGHYAIAIFLDNKTSEPVYFNLEKPKHVSKERKPITAKEVQAAIKEGVATPDLLQAEIDRIKQREKRSEELDAEKVQLSVHNQFTEFAGKLENNTSLTNADMTGARLIIYQSLDYSARNEVAEKLLSGKKGKRDYDTSNQLYERMSNLTEQEFTYLIRMAICLKSESKYPLQQAGYFLYQMAKDAGVLVETIEHAQDEKRKERKEKQQVRIKELKKQIEKIKTE
jgi:ParB family chromosome partitioning protein